MKIAFHFCPIVALLGWIFVASLGCSDSAALQPGDVRTYLAPSTPTTTVKATPRPSADGALALAYEVPDGWADLGATGMRLASLAIEEGDQKYEVTVIPAAGTLEANVSRWLGQLDGSAPPESLLERTTRVLAAAKTQPVGEAEATLVTLMDEAAKDTDEVILGAMIPLDETASLFVKFKGPAAVARREQEAFSRFVSSIRWNQEARR
jgi:hypothetical protein